MNMFLKLIFIDEYTSYHALVCNAGWSQNTQTRFLHFLDEIKLDNFLQLLKHIQSIGPGQSYSKVKFPKTESVNVISVFKIKSPQSGGKWELWFLNCNFWK